MKEEQPTTKTIPVPEVKTKCRSCKTIGPVPHYVTTIGPVCPACFIELRPLSDVIDQTELMNYPASKPDKLRQALRVLQQLGLNYDLTRTDTHVTVQVRFSEERRHLTIRNYRAVKHRVADLLRAQSCPQET